MSATENVELTGFTKGDRSSPDILEPLFKDGSGDASSASKGPPPVDISSILCVDNESVCTPNSEPDRSLCFENGEKRIDFVLAYKVSQKSLTGDEKIEDDMIVERREAFLESLQLEGVEIEFTDLEGANSTDGCTVFVKLHGTWELLTRYAEMTRMKMPIQKFDMRVDDINCCSKIMSFPTLSRVGGFDFHYYTAVFDRRNMGMFVFKSRDSFFSNSQRSRLVWQALLRTKYTYSHEKKGQGVKELISCKAIEDAFPLHDGGYKVEKGSVPTCDRQYLYDRWVHPRNFYKQQPFGMIRRYFGEKVGLYFAFLGYYTTMLIPASIVGLICFLYGLITMSSDISSKEICDLTGVGNFTLCPMCDRQCPFEKLSRSCMYSKLTYLFDNDATVFFTMFMALWATLFLEFWKRQQAGLQYEWDIENFKEQEEALRPEYEKSVKKRRTNPITKMQEPYLPFSDKAPRYVATISVVFFFLITVIGTVIGIVVYRIVVMTLLYKTGKETGFSTLSEYAKITTSISAALISLVVIFILSKLYYRIAIELTKLETHRTETSYDESLTWKMFIFQFFNYYATIFYVAFFKGRVPAKPRPQAYINFLGGSYHSEECDAGGCIVELWIQLLIIMVGKQFFSNVQELLFPVVQTWFAKRKSSKLAATGNAYTRYEQDYDLIPTDRMYLFWEYLELVLQFGFVTIFVCAFPLAPIFALLNNIIEIRIDALKFITQWRRPVAHRAQDIGSWYGILGMMVKLAVFSSALLIAFTSSFVDKSVYYYVYSNHTLEGYVENTLSAFSTADFAKGAYPEFYDKAIFGENVTTCYYPDYRTPPKTSIDSPEPYSYTIKHWHVIAAKLGFVLIFEHVAFVVSMCAAFFIPDIPSHVRMKSLRARHITRDFLWAQSSSKA